MSTFLCLHADLLVHTLQFAGLRERVAVLLTCRQHRDNVLAARVGLMAQCSPPDDMKTWNVQQAAGAGGIHAFTKRTRVQLCSSHVVTVSLKNVCIFGGGTASLARGSDSPKGLELTSDGTRWLGRNYVCGLLLNRVEVCGGHTTLVGCLVIDGVKVGPGATLHLIGCTIYSYYPHGLRVGKGASLVATECRFVSERWRQGSLEDWRSGSVQLGPQPLDNPASHYEALRSLSVPSADWTDSRSFSNATLWPLYHVRGERCRAMTFSRCSFSQVGAGASISIELGNDELRMDRLVVEECDIHESRHSVQILRGVLPTVLLIRRNRFRSSVFVNNGRCEVLLEGNSFSPEHTAVEAVNGVHVKVIDSLLSGGHQLVAWQGSSIDAHRCTVAPRPGPCIAGTLW